MTLVAMTRRERRPGSAALREASQRPMMRSVVPGTHRGSEAGIGYTVEGGWLILAGGGEEHEQTRQPTTGRF